MYIVRSKHTQTICQTIEDALEEYFWRLSFTEFVEILKVLPGNATEQVRRSW